MKYIVFGSWREASHWARVRNLAPGDWRHAGSREQVMGLEPTNFEAVRLHGADNAAVGEWLMRGGSFEPRSENGPGST